MSGQSRKRRSDGREQVYRGARRLGWLFSALVTLCALCAVFFIWLFPTRIVDESMSPALQSGEVVLCDRLAKFTAAPERGDIILFQTQDGGFIKRIVGLPGETVEIVEGNVYIDSRPLDESMYASNGTGEMAPVTVPMDSVFVLGDNRVKVYDSRLESVGCIPYTSIHAVMRLRIYPIERFTIFY